MKNRLGNSLLKVVNFLSVTQRTSGQQFMAPPSMFIINLYLLRY